MRKTLPLLAALLLANTAEAKVVRVVEDSRVPVYNGQSIGASGPYERVQGRIFGEVDPTDPHNAMIQDLTLAPRNAAGNVEYIATFTILKPAKAAGSTGMMLYQVSNRGGRAEPAAAAVIPGASYVWTGWQADLLAKPCITDYPCTKLTAPTDGVSELLQAPIARKPDGSPLTGPVYGSIINASGNTAQMVIYTTPIPYRPATIETSAAHFFKVLKQTVDGRVREKVEIPGSDWAWADCRTTAFPGTPDPTRVCLKQGFDPNLEYDMSFTARDPLVLGLGFAATRDAVAFFRASKTAENPLAGMIAHTIAQGISQSGNYLRSFVHWGFNADEAGKPVFDGLFPTIAGRQLALNIRFGLPDVIQTIFMPATEGPTWWAHYADAGRNRKAAGMLDACEASLTCPKIFESFGSTEFWALKMSIDLLGSAAKSDIPVPSLVRRYYFPGTKHGGGAGGFSEHAGAPAANGTCEFPDNPNPQSDQNAALLDALIAWVVDNREPPASTYPILPRGDLVAPTKAAMHFPTIPGVNFTDNLANPLMELDFGPGFDPVHHTGAASIQPPTIKRLFPTLVPSTNADGNEAMGEPSVQHLAPLGTYVGWNRWAIGARKGQVCNLAGAFFPFPVTRAERSEKHDPRPSLQERYGSHEGFVCAVQAATAREAKRRFLRPADAVKLVKQAQASDVLVGVTPDTKIADKLCQAVKP